MYFYRLWSMLCRAHECERGRAVFARPFQCCLLLIKGAFSRGTAPQRLLLVGVGYRLRDGGQKACRSSGVLKTLHSLIPFIYILT